MVRRYRLVLVPQNVLAKVNSSVCLRWPLAFIRRKSRGWQIERAEAPKAVHDKRMRLANNGPFSSFRLLCFNRSFICLLSPLLVFGAELAVGFVPSR